MRYDTTMLHELNFCDWRKSQRRTYFLRWLAALMLALAVLSVIEWRMWQAYTVNEDRLLLQVRQAEISVNTLKQRSEELQEREAHYQKERELLQQWQQVIDAAKRPLNVMRIIRNTLPDGMYLDQLTMEGVNIYINGLVEKQVFAAHFATKLQKNNDVNTVSQLRLASPISRWQSQLFPFQLQLQVKTVELSDVIE